MGSVLSSACAALRSFVKAQLDKIHDRLLMAIYPSLRDLPADELQVRLRRLKDEMKQEAKHSLPLTEEDIEWLRQIDNMGLEYRCKYMPVSMRKLKN